MLGRMIVRGRRPEPCNRGIAAKEEAVIENSMCSSALSNHRKGGGCDPFFCTSYYIDSQTDICAATRAARNGETSKTITIYIYEVQCQLGGIERDGAQ